MQTLFDNNDFTKPNKHLRMIGASNRLNKRPTDDYYATPLIATEALLSVETFEGTIWEPACGAGDISKILENAGYQVYSSDANDHGYGDAKINFLAQNKVFDNIITNPPYKLAEEFVYKAKTLARRKIAFLLRTLFLESVSRYYLFKDKEFPLKAVYQFSKRIGMKTDRTKNSMLAFAWFVWDKNHTGKPYIDWIL